jgi:ubiquinone/menaquinone biosynthesis C-methylase UbiE
MEALPWPAATFDVVTGFNAFQFAADPANALREAKRVAKVGGQVALVVWGGDADVDLLAVMAAIGRLLPSTPRAEAVLPFSAPSRIEALLEEARLTPLAKGVLECPFAFPDLETAVRAIMSSGAAVAAVRQVGATAVQQAIAESLAAFRTSEGGYRQYNLLRYAIASA